MKSILLRNLLDPDCSATADDGELQTDLGLRAERENPPLGQMFTGID